MSDTLSKIGMQVARRLAERQERLPLHELRQKAFTRTPHDFLTAFPADRINVIAEVKRASPTQPQLALGLKPLNVAESYLSSGAVALSVVTEADFFRGHIDYLKEIRQQFPAARLLMKDFFIDEYQLYEACHAGADAILLIMAMLSDAKGKELYNKAHDLGLTPLVEVHNEEELARAKQLGAKLIGVNNRNLKTLQIDLNVSLQLAGKLPAQATAVSESGIATHQDITRLYQAGYRGFLIGSSLMATGHPGAALAKLLQESRHA